MNNQKKLFVTYFVMIGALILSTISAAQAATFTVDTAFDQIDNLPGDGICNAGIGVCTLRAAIQEANALPGSDVIEFSSSFAAPNPPQTIVLTHGQLFVDSSLTINGTGARQLIIDGDDKDRVFLVNSSFQNQHTVLISNLTVQNGTPSPNGYAQGGGIFVAYTDLTLSNVTVRNNTTVKAVLGQPGQGDGGGIFNFASVLSIRDCTISNNVAEVGGGGILARDGRLDIYNSTISDNVAKISGGGVYQRDNGTIRNSTITNNYALQNGGGIFIDNVNPQGFHNIGNTIVANNFAPVNRDVSGEMISLGNNLVKSRGNSTGYVSADLPDGTDPLLGGLQNNGGSTNTRALLAGSPAINAGNDCIVVGNSCRGDFKFDQRGLGYWRKVGSAVDIGAFELQGRERDRSEARDDINFVPTETRDAGNQ